MRKLLVLLGFVVAPASASFTMVSADDGGRSVAADETSTTEVGASTTELSTTTIEAATTTEPITTTTELVTTTETVTTTTETTTTTTTTTTQPATTTTTTLPPVAVPSAPRSLTATPVAPGSLRLTWLPAVSNGGAAVTDYVIERSPNGTSSWTTVSDGVSTTASFTVTGLGSTLRYYFRVMAKNAVGPGASSNVVNAIARTAPSAPRSLVARPLTAGSIRLSWLPAVSNGGAAVTDYVIQRSPNGTSGWTTMSDGVNTTASYSATGLSSTVRYYFRVLAKNAVGTGGLSNVVNVIPRTAPSAPRSLAARGAASGQVRLSWLPATSNGGAAVTDYVVQRSPNGTSGWTTVNDGVRTATAYTVGGLTNGVRYYFRVLAKNVVGLGAVSNLVSAIPRTVPGAPRSLAAARAASGQVRLSWLAPASNGGAAVTDYVIQRSPNGTSGWTTVNDGVRTATAYTVGGLTNGVRYYFRVLARNTAGSSRVSSVASAVPSAPRAPSPPPRNPACHPSYPTVCVAWTGADLDCPQVPHSDFRVITPPAPYARDPHGFDRDRDGIGCES